MEKVWTEQRIYTRGEQVALIQPNETMDGLILSFEETTEKRSSSRLYLSYDEAVELTNVIKSMVDRYKSNSL